jgi:hypothetical protein
MRSFLAISAAMAFFALALLAPLSARTLTAADGRSIEVEVLGFEPEDKVIIKRADTGQTFTLPISTFSAADQRALRAEAAEAAKNPPPLPANALTLELSRARFDSRREKRELRMSDGTVRRDAITITEEDWGFSIALRNNTTRPIEGLRGEYILFVKVDQPGVGQSDNRLRRSRERLEFEAMPPGGRVSARTSAITARRTALAPGIVWAGTNDSKSRDTLHGIWLRIYQGDTLVLESASPASLTTTESWGGEGGRR